MKALQSKIEKSGITQALRTYNLQLKKEKKKPDLIVQNIFKETFNRFKTETC